MKITRVEERIQICLKTKLEFKVILKLKLKKSKRYAVGEAVAMKNEQMNKWGVRARNENRGGTCGGEANLLSTTECARC